MKPVERRSFRTLAVTTAIAGCAAFAAVPAHAEDPLTTVVDLGGDSATLVTDSVLDLARGCTPVVTSWQPLAMTYTPFIKNNSTYYHFTGGGIAHLNCSGTYKVDARLLDDAPPPWYMRLGPHTPTVVTSANPQDSGYVDVPYVGPDAPVLRPGGKITVHVDVYKRLSTGRYAAVPNGCNEWHYVVQPTVPLTVSDPTQQSACPETATFLANDIADGISEAAAIGADSPEAPTG